MMKSHRIGSRSKLGLLFPDFTSEQEFLIGISWFGNFFCWLLKIFPASRNFFRQSSGTWWALSRGPQALMRPPRVCGARAVCEFLRFCMLFYAKRIQKLELKILCTRAIFIYHTISNDFQIGNERKTSFSVHPNYSVFSRGIKKKRLMCGSGPKAPKPTRIH